jgi:hypothetical protein
LDVGYVSESYWKGLSDDLPEIVALKNSAFRSLMIKRSLCIFFIRFCNAHTGISSYLGGETENMKKSEKSSLIRRFRIEI